MDKWAYYAFIQAIPSHLFSFQATETKCNPGEDTTKAIAQLEEVGERTLPTGVDQVNCQFTDSIDNEA